MIPSSNLNNTLYGLNLRLDNIHFDRKVLYQKHKGFHSLLNLLASLVELILTIRSSPQKQLAWQNCGIGFGRLSWCQLGTKPDRPGQRPPGDCVSRSASSRCGCLSRSQSQGWKWERPQSLLPRYSTSKCRFPFPWMVGSLPTRLSSKEECFH